MPESYFSYVKRMEKQAADDYAKLTNEEKIKALEGYFEKLDNNWAKQMYDSIWPKNIPNPGKAIITSTVSPIDRFHELLKDKNAKPMLNINWDNLPPPTYFNMTKDDKEEE